MNASLWAGTVSETLPETLPETLWLAVPLAPLLAALLVLILRRDIAPWLWLTCLPALMLALVPATPLTASALWPGANWGLEDLLSRALLALTAALWAAAGCYAASTQQTDPERKRFWLFWLFALTGNLLLIIAKDSISFYVGFTLMSLSAYGLVAHLPGPAPRQAGRIYLQLAILGEMLLYAGLMMRLGETGGGLNFSDWQETPVRPLTAGLLIVGLGLKAGFWPLHLWLPQAHPAAPPAASAILSGAMLKAGILGLWRFLPENDAMLNDWAGIFVALGLFTAFYGALAGLIQQKAKVVLAYSSISQMGYLLAIVALAWHRPEQQELWMSLLALYAVHHGFAKGALFLGAGLAAKHWLRRWHWWVLTVPAFALAGLPLTSGGAVKTQLKSLLEETDYYGELWLLSLGSLATALVVARALWLMRPALASDSSPEDKPPLPALMACLSLGIMSLLLPWLWSDMRSALVYSLTLPNSWALAWPLVLAALIILGGSGFGGKFRSGVRSGVESKPESELGSKFGLKLRELSHLARSPARPLSLKLKQYLQLLTVREAEPKRVQTFHKWRARERRWNRFWQRGSVSLSAWILCALLLLGWLW